MLKFDNISTSIKEMAMKPPTHSTEMIVLYILSLKMFPVLKFGWVITSLWV